MKVAVQVKLQAKVKVQAQVTAKAKAKVPLTMVTMRRATRLVLRQEARVKGKIWR